MKRTCNLEYNYDIITPEEGLILFNGDIITDSLIVQHNQEIDDWQEMDQSEAELILSNKEEEENDYGYDDYTEPTDDSEELQVID